MAISKKKKRYNVTLTPVNVDRFQALCDHFGLPPGTMSNAVNDAISGLSDALQAAKDEGMLSNEILWRLFGKQQELIKLEEVKNDDSQQKRNSTRIKKNAA